MEAYSLYEVNEYIRRVIALNFDEPIWIECEIGQINEVRGQVYIDVIEKSPENDSLLAQAQAVIWFKEFLFIKKKLGDLTDGLLQEGVKIKMKATIDFHEKYGMKFVISDIDPSYSLGMFQLAKQKILERLRKAEVIDLNNSIPLPQIIKRIAVISSSTAAGYQDFMNQLNSNPYGYAFHAELFPAAMQGMNTEREVVNQLKIIEHDKASFDIIIIIRGGGSKMDLASFDNYNIAFSISQSSLPVLTGIGHDIDETVTDIVAHTILKTPTAVADFILEHNARQEAEIIQIEQTIGYLAQIMLSNIKEELLIFQGLLTHRPREIILQKTNQIVRYEEILKLDSQAYIEQLDQTLDFIEEQIQLVNPVNVLKRGYAMVKQSNSLKTKVADINKSKKLTLEMKDGKIDLIVDKK